MSSESDSEDDLLIFMMYNIIKKRKKHEQMGVQDLHLCRSKEGEFYKLIPQLKTDDRLFQNYYKMTKETYFMLLEKVTPIINDKQNSFKKAISVDERLTLTLRFLATGDTFKALASRFHIAHNIISSIVQSTCSAIWEALSNEYMELPNIMRWNQIADEFMIKNQFPNCLGAIDGRHIKIQCPRTKVYNVSEGYTSIEVMAVVDSNYMFTVVDVDLYKIDSEENITCYPRFGRMITNEEDISKLRVPENQPLSSSNKTEVPFVFVGEKTLKLTTRMMKPYPDRLTSDLKKSVFNNRLYRAAQVADYAFGMLVYKWRLFEKQITFVPEKVDSIIKAACVLHNYIRTFEEELQNEYLVEALGYSNCLPPMFSKCPINRKTVSATSASARKVRDLFADFFISSEGAVVGQEKRKYVIDENI